MSADDEPPSPIEISIQNPEGFPEIGESRLRPWLADLLPEVAPQRTSFAARFVGDRAIRDLNRAFRHRDAVTDVLSFPGTRDQEGYPLGDVVISVPAALRQAAGESEREIKRLLLHGVLHCLGFDHETDDGRMERLEKELCRRWIGPALEEANDARMG